MTPWKAAQPGDPLSAVDTPALVLDLDAVERNLARMADALRGAGVRRRPHAKSHKCPEVARRQIALGAIGICCQKVSEAAVFVEAGITDILLTNQVVGATKARQLAQIARRAHVGVLVDDPLQVQTLSQAAQAHAVVFDVYVEVDVGAGRCGVAPGAPVAALARAIVDAGLKASSIDAGLPTVWRRPALTFVKAADEHGVLETPADAGLALGDALMLVPGHCDPTVNLYDELVCLRAGSVEAIWPIAARGALL